MFLCCVDIKEYKYIHWSLGDIFLVRSRHHLILEAAKNLPKHIFELCRWVVPTSQSITEEEEVLNNPTRVQTDHQTHASERRLLFLVVSNVPGIQQVIY